MASGEKRKYVFLTIADKLKLIERLEAGWPTKTVAQEFGVGVTTVKDLKKNKEKLKLFSEKFEACSSVCKIRKTMRLPPSEAIDEAVYKWLNQHRASGITVRSSDILAAADRFAKQLNLNFKSSNAWLWRFRNRHGLPNMRNAEPEPEGGDDIVEVGPFRQKVNEIIEQSSLSLAQLYNFDETGLLYRMLPEDMQAVRHEDQLSRERLSALLCANANGSHRMTPAIVGRSQESSPLKTCLHRLPVHYYQNSNAWFTRDIVKDWFFRYAEPEIRRFQIEELKIAPGDIRALILMDKAPTHPDSTSLSSSDGRIKCLAIPPNVSLTQPLEQGVILTTKRLYRKKFLDEVLVPAEENASIDYSIHGPRASANMKNYNLKAAIYNFADAWRDVPHATLTNSWKRLLNNSDVQWEMEGIETGDFLKALTAAGETEVTEASVFTWLEEDEVDPGYQVLSEEEIVREVLQARGDGAPEDTSDEVMEESQRSDLSIIRNHCDDILTYINNSDDPAVQEFYEHFRNFKKLIIRRQQRSASERTVHSFFGPPSATSTPALSATPTPEPPPPSEPDIEVKMEPLEPVSDCI